MFVHKTRKVILKLKYMSNIYKLKNGGDIVMDTLTLNMVREITGCVASVIIIVYFIMSIIHLVKKW